MCLLLEEGLSESPREGLTKIYGPFIASEAVKIFHSHKEPGAKV